MMGGGSRAGALPRARSLAGAIAPARGRGAMLCPCSLAGATAAAHTTEVVS
jgi:hypothetical protein